MFDRLRRTGIVSVAAIAFAVPAAAPAASPQQATLQAMTGNWTCVTHDSSGKTWNETDVGTMWGSWLKTESTFPAQNGQPAGSGLTFLGYDAANRRWYVSFLNTAGEYGSAYSTSKTWGGSKWQDGYPNNHGSSSITASKNQFSIDTKMAGANGKTMTSHEVCTKE